MKETLAAIWEAIPRAGQGLGWQSIAILPEAPCQISAAIRLPEDLEAVIIETGANAILPSMKFPEARGFKVVLERRSPGPNGRVLVILQRTEGGSRDLFAQVAEDALHVAGSAKTVENAVREFVARIIAWMKFMNELRDSGLSDDEEVGLLGEIIVAGELLNVMAAEATTRAWVGPTDGLHDFHIGSCAIEVKTTLGVQDVIHVFSLDQLDPSALDALYLLRVHLRLDQGGWTLPEWADQLLARCGDSANEVTYKLLLAGVSEVNRGQFTRRFALQKIDAYRVDEKFPHLCRANVPPAISQASYRLDLRLAREHEVAVAAALSAAGEAANVG